MKLIATLVYNRKKAIDILKEIPNNAVVLFPENVNLSFHAVRYYSKKKNLFIIYNDDGRVDGKCYNSMFGVDRGKLKWMVHKYFLWDDENDYTDKPPHPDPAVNIRGHKTCIAICYEIAFVSRFNKLYTIGKIAKKHKVEIMMLPANWEFNWTLPQCIMTSAFNCIPSLKVGLFSCRRELAFVSSKKNRTKITNKGWISIEI